MQRLLLIGLITVSTIYFGRVSAATPEFVVSFSAATHREPITGRILLFISQKDNPEVRLQPGWWVTPPVFGLEVSNMPPGKVVVVDSTVLGYPVRSTRNVAPGDYYVQAVLNIYTRFRRADGHTIWAHMDQWEGQQPTRSPGNLYSEVYRVHIGDAHSERVELVLTNVIPPVEIPKDTEWVKHIKIQSKLLSAFWGRPMYLGAVILLPRDYSSHPESYYPVIYQQSHFSHEPPFQFTTQQQPETEEAKLWRKNVGVENGYQFSLAWRSDGFPRVIAATLLHPTPYYDDSYAVNSANNGPYGDAIMTELIPYIEKQFRIIARPSARLLTGVSTGGWEALALQVFHPEFFGGTWAFYPDPVDFRRYALIDIYRDENAFVFDPASAPEWFRQVGLPVERPLERTDDGQTIVTVRQEAWLESVLGGNARSGTWLQNYEAVFGSVDTDGYPKSLWNKTTGEIDHSVADYMRRHGYDLRYYVQTNWDKIGQQLVGKLHVYCGDMDNLYLNLAVYLLQKSLESSKKPYYAGSFEYGRPLKGHGWQPMPDSDLVRVMAAYAAAHLEDGASLSWKAH